MSDDRIAFFKRLLTLKEAVLVNLLAAANGALIARDALLANLNGCAPRTLDTYAKQIRIKLRAAGLDPKSLKTHTGKGYSLSLEADKTK